MQGFTKTEINAKKKTLHAAQAESERVQRLRVEYWQAVAEIEPQDLIFIDETGMNLGLSRTCARSIQGTRAYGTKPYYRGANISLIGAISLKGFLGSMTVNGSTDGATFRVFVEKILVPCLWSGATVVMDNLSAHKVKGISELIEAAGAKIIYLSPYSPELNPIESCWSKLKEYLRSVSARTRETLELALVQGFDLMTLKDIRNWFTHCCYCTSCG
jgi:transposase